MHEPFLLAALDQAWLGRGLCAPNPSVGAVAVRDGQIIAQAWHRGSGTPHAEVLLLEQLPKNISEITLYVTLEPCNHWGKTPPCVDAIVQSGIRRVVYAYRDPNPLVVYNDTPRLLQAHGIEVIYQPLDAIDAFYKSYRHWMMTQRPWVTVKMAHTLDGKIAGVSGARVSLSNETCAEFTHQQRRHTDIILTTAKTIHHDDPLLNARLSEGVFSKTLAIIDRQLTLSESAQILGAAKHCHFFCDEHVSRPTLPSALFSYHGVSSTEARLDLTAIIERLGHLGFHDVWVEAGGTLFSQLHHERLVNTTHLYVVPSVLGDDATPMVRHVDIFDSPHDLSWTPMGNNMMATFEWEH